MIVLVAVLLSVLLGFSALAVDTSVLYLQDAQLQTAVDAGVLAGASALPNTVQAESLCRSYILENCEGAQNIIVTFEGQNTVINATAQVTSDALFSRIFGNESLDGAAKASAERTMGGMGGPFHYRLFSGKAGSQITLGGKFLIDGDIHSNGSVSISPSSGTVTGAVEGCTTVSVNQWTAKVGSQVPGAAFIDMVDFSSVVDNVLLEHYPVTEPASTYNSPWWLQNISGDIYINGNVSISNRCTITGNLYVNGNVTINGGSPVCVLKGSIYSTGKIDFNNSVQVDGFVFAKGDINFRGAMTQVNANSEVCIYSQTGNIYISTAGNEIHGIVYAPKGSVNIVGGTTNFYGSIIGYTIAGIPADFNILPPDNDFDFLPEGAPVIRLIR